MATVGSEERFEALAKAQVIEGRRKEVADQALENIRDGNGFTRDAARNTLKKWAGKDSVPALLLLIDDHDGGVRQLGLEILGKLKDERAVIPIALRLRPDREHASKALQNLGRWPSPRC